MSAGFDPGTGLGPRLRLAREERQLSVRELARRIGCSASLISQIERGISIPSVGVLYSLATELDSSLDHLLFGADPRRPAAEPAVTGAEGATMAEGATVAELGPGGQGPAPASAGRASSSGRAAGASSTWPAACAGSGSRPARTP